LIDFVAGFLFGLNLFVVDSQVRISNATGTRSSLFIPEEAFEQLVKMQIKVCRIQ
jgi:hypothetical protein